MASTLRRNALHRAADFSSAEASALGAPGQHRRAAVGGELGG